MLEVGGNLRSCGDRMIAVKDFRFRRILGFKSEPGGFKLMYCDHLSRSSSGLRKLYLYDVHSAEYANDLQPQFPLLEELSIACVGLWVLGLLRREVLPHLRSLRLDKSVSRGIILTTISPLLSHLEILSVESDRQCLSYA